MNFSGQFEQKLKNKIKGFEKISSSPSELFDQLSEEYKTELNENHSLKFKRDLLEKVTSIGKNSNTQTFNIFDDFIPKEEVAKVLVEEEICEIKNQIEYIESSIEEKEIFPVEDLVSLSVNSINKEEFIKENTNLFSRPDIKLVDPTIKQLQNKLKYLEDWISKISMAGPGSGEVNFRWLDDVDRSTIGNTDQILRYNPEDNKFFFGQLSGDQGPIRSLEFDNSGTTIQNPNAGTLYWNSSKDCLNIHQNDETYLQVGLENYIRVHNVTGNILYKGTLVQFSGVNGDHETPTCVPFLADGEVNPIYVVGVLSEDILHDGYGRATNLGEVRNINTTGSSISEVWQEGDLLWASDTMPGKLTKIRPTAPSVVISIAAVLRVNSSTGILLVRPTIFPRLYYGSFYDTTTQSVSQINTPYPIKVNSTQISSGFFVSNNSQITANNAGLYNYQFSLQVSSQSSDTKNLWIWYRKNGQDVPNSATKVSISSNKEIKAPAWNFIESMEIGGYFQLMWAADSTDVKISAIANTSFCPAVPSVILTVTQITL